MPNGANAQPDPTPVQYKPIPYSYTTLTDEQQKKLTQDHVNAVHAAMGNYQGKQPVPNEGSVAVFKDANGQTMYYLNQSNEPGADRWAHMRGYPGSRPGPWNEPMADTYRGMERGLAQGTGDSPAGLNPFTNKPWGVNQDGTGQPVSPYDMTVGQLHNYSGLQTQYNRLKPIDMTDFEGSVNLKQLTDHAVDLVKSIPPRDMGYLAQNWNKVKDMTDSDLQGLGESYPQSKAKLEDLASTLEQMGNQGAQVSGLPGQGEGGKGITGAISSGLKNLGLIVRGPGSAAAVAGVQGVAGLLDKIGDNTFDINKVAASLGKFDNQLTQSMVRRMNDLTSSGLQYRIPNETVDYTNNTLIPQLQKQGIGLYDNAWGQTKNLFDYQPNEPAPTTTQPTPTPSPTPQAAGVPWRPQAAPLNQAIDAVATRVTKDPLGTLQSAGDAARTFVRNTMPFGQWIMPSGETQTPEEKAQPLFPRAPHTPGATPGAPAATQNAQPASPAPIQVQPLETPQLVPQSAPGPQKLTSQADVDALQPGTPFYWQDHPNAYVKT